MDIITCDKWGAAPPKHPIELAPSRPVRVIDHHTAGHAPDLDHKPSESYEEAQAYARALQQFHFGRGWADTGQNFLVSRSGHVFEGRHGTVRALLVGRMVVSAHCPGQNDQPGIEHEQLGDEQLTPAQIEASIELHVWICKHTGIRPTEFFPHHQFYATSCPGTVIDGWLPKLRGEVAKRLTATRGTSPAPVPPERRSLPPAFWDWAQWRLGRGPWYGNPADPNFRPGTVPAAIPAAWWDRLQRLVTPK